MADVGVSSEKESRPQDLVNNEECNMRDDEIQVNMNESMNDNPSELLQRVKYLREELKRVKEYNECKAQEELNNALLTKLHSNEQKNNKVS